MKIILLCLLILPFCIKGQSGKGVSPISSNSANPNRQTRAVVIGISDYQDPAIPDLRFADKDAEAFATWLHSPAGGGVSSENIQVLLNQEATTGKIIAALGGLVSDCKSGDVALIYFSGHGDVERISKYQRGYWLTWDSPPAMYAAGACSLGYLQDIISTLSESGVQVMIFADACRAGKLAGSSVGGTQATSAALAQQFANEVKILSCQPNEYSLEGAQWGGGRGAFSFHLVDALYGLADVNGDGIINLFELGRYLEDKVPIETAPHAQMPFTVGNKAIPIAKVDAGQLAQWKQQKAGTALTFNKIDMRTLEDMALANADSSLRSLYREFVAALERGDFMEVADGSRRSANELYEMLLREPALADLRGLMTRNFAAALMDEGQQILNRLLSGDLLAFDVLENEIGINYHQLANKFYRAAELLGEKHYYYPGVKAKGLYFEAKSIRKLDISFDSANFLSYKRMWQAVSLDSTAVYAWLSQDPPFPPVDSLDYYIKRMENVAPNWIILHLMVGEIENERNSAHPEKAMHRYLRALALDSTSFLACAGMEAPLKALGRPDEAARWRETALRIGMQKMENSPQLLADYEWSTLAKLLVESGKTTEFEQLAQAYLRVEPLSMHRLDYYAQIMKTYARNTKAEQAYRQMMALDSTDVNGWNGLGWLCYDQRRYVEMEQLFRKCILLAPKNEICWRGLGWALARQKKYAEAETSFFKSLDLYKRSLSAWNGLGRVYLDQKRYSEAEQAYRKYIEFSAYYPKLYEASGWYSLGRVLEDAERDTEAEAAYRKAVSLDSINVIAWERLASYLNGAERYLEAEAAFRKAVSLDSSNATAWNSLAFCLSRTEQYDAMVPICRQALALDSTNASVWNNFGFALLQTHRYAEAEPALKRAIALSPNFPNAHKHLGTLALRTGRREEARKSFEKALELNPNYFGGYLGMAYLLSSENETREALKALEQAIGKNASFSQLSSDEDLAHLRALPEWKALIKKYFPDKMKD